MMTDYIPYAVAVVLIGATFMDLRTGKLPNWLIYIFFGLFILQAATMSDPSVLGWQLGFAVAAFAVGLGLYAIMGVGAGGVKLLAGVALFMPMNRWLALLGLLLLTFYLGGLVVALLRRTFGGPDSQWAVMGKRVMSLSLPICVTGLLGLFWL